MTATAHALVGAAIAAKIPSPLIGLPLAFLSHFACDKIPHWDVMTDKSKSRMRVFAEIAIDNLLGLFLVAAFILFFHPQTSPVYIFASALAAQSPDWWEGPYVLFNHNLPFSKEAYRLQKWFHDIGFNSRLAAPWGVVTNIIAAVVFLTWAVWR